MNSAPIYSEQLGHTSVSTDLDWILREAVKLSRAHGDVPVDIRRFTHTRHDGRYFGVLHEPVADFEHMKGYIIGHDESEFVAIVTAPDV